MIKLIRRGSPKVIEYTCNKCGSLFSFEEEDLIEKEIRKGSPWLNKFILLCPGCHEEIVFNNKDYPFKYGGHHYCPPISVAKSIKIKEG